MISVVSSAAQRLRHREQRETTRREILAAAERFLRESPYRELSVDIVMAQTGLTRTAFYRHFDDIPDLVLRLLSQVGRELYEVAERWGETAGANYPDPARRALAGIVDFFARNGALVRAVAEAAASDERIERAYQTSIETFIEMTTRAFDRMVAEGQLDVPDTRALAKALNLMNEAYLLQEFGRQGEGDPEVALATLETVWLRVAAPPS